MVPSPARALTWTGRILVTVGLLIVAFAGFQLWGTGLAEARAQDELSRELAARLEASTTSPSPSRDHAVEPGTGESSPTSAPVASATSQPAARSWGLDPGHAAGRIIIPAIALDKVFVEGVERDHLRRGPGRYPDNPWPGRAGNAAIAGHRTTHGAPFFDLDRLKPGDEIIIETFDGRFRYRVEGHDTGGGTAGHFIVDPWAVDVLDDKGDNRLTLTACHPKYSAAQRIIVTAILVEEPVPSEAVDQPMGRPDGWQAPAGGVSTPDDRVESSSTDGAAAPVDSGISMNASLGWQPHYLWPTVAGAALTAAIAAAAWWTSRHRNRWAVYAVSTAPFLASMFWWFTNLDKLLPAV